MANHKATSRAGRQAFRRAPGLCCLGVVAAIALAGCRLMWPTPTLVPTPTPNWLLTPPPPSPAALAPLPPTPVAATVEAQYIQPGAPTVVPIVYKMYDWQGIDYQHLRPELGPIGARQFYRWDDLNPAPGVYDWALIDQALAANANLKVTLFDGRDIQKPIFLEFKAHISSKPGWEAEFYDATPTWVYDRIDRDNPRDLRPVVLGRKVGHVVTGCDRPMVLPMYENRTWQEAYFIMVRAFGARYGNHPQVTAIGVSTGFDGETSVVRDKGCSYTKFLEQVSSDVTWAFAEFVVETLDVYRSAFPRKALFIQNAPGGSYIRKLSADYAASRQPPVGMQHSGLLNDVEHHQGYGKFIGSWDMYRAYSTTVPIWVESMFGMSQREAQYWSYLAGLHFHPDGADFHDEFFITDHPEDLRFLGRHLGVTLQTSPDVWTVLRDYEFPYLGWNSGGQSGHIGDWTFWLYRSDTAPQSGGERVNRQDMPAARTHVFSRQARRTRQDRGQPYMSFSIDDGYPYVAQKPIDLPGGKVHYIVYVTILNHGSDTFALQYRNWDGAIVSQVQRKGPSLGLEGDWVEVRFVVKDGFFANNMPGDVDFRVSCENDGDEYIHMVRVEGGWGEPKTPTPTPLPAPTLTATPTGYPTPASSGTPGPSPSPKPGSPTPEPTLTLTPVATPTYVPDATRLEPQDDTYLDRWETRRNWGDSPYLIARTGDIKAPLLKFDLSAMPPGSPIERALLTMRVVRRSNAGYLTLSVHRALRPWDEGGATWEEAQLGTAWSQAGCNDPRWDRSTVAVTEVNLTEDNHWYDLDITDLVRAWVNDPTTNYGLVLKAGGQVAVEYAFASSSYPDPNSRPRLQVIKGGGTPPPTKTSTPVTVVPSATPQARLTKVVLREGQGSTQVPSTFLDSWNEDRNYSQSEVMSARPNVVRVPLLRFDLSPIPEGVSVKSAVLHLYAVGRSNPHAMTLGIARVNREWDPSRVTWNQTTASEAWYEPGARDVAADRSGRLYAAQSVTAFNTWTHYDVSALVQEWVSDPTHNYGLLMVPEGNVSVQYDFGSSRWPVRDLRPYLEVEYLPVKPSPTPTLTQIPTRWPTPTSTPLGVRGQYVFQQGLGGYNGCTDAYVDQWNPTKNTTGEDVFVVRSGNVRSSLLRFDLSAIPVNSRIVAAQLSLYALYRSNANHLPVQIHAALRRWDAVEATFQRASRLLAWAKEGASEPGVDLLGAPSASFEAAAVQRVHTVDIAGLVQEWVDHPERNYGMVLKGGGGTAVEYAFFSANAWQGGVMRPRLAIGWEAAPPVPTVSGTPATPTRTSTPVPTATSTPIPTPTRPRAKVAFQRGLGGYEGVSDTFMDSWSAVSAAGSSDILLVRQNNVRSSILRFDLMSLPQNAMVLEGRLDLWINTSSNPSALSLRAYLLRRPWDEDTATWLQAGATTPWGRPGAGSADKDRDPMPIGEASISGANTWASIDLSPAVREWLVHPEENYGVVLVGEGRTSVEYEFASSQSRLSNRRPKLLVGYEILPEVEATARRRDLDRGIGLLVSLAGAATLIALLWRYWPRRRLRRE